MTQHGLGPNKSAIVAALTGLLNELRLAVTEMLGLTAEVQELSIKVAKADKFACNQARREGAPVPVAFPERELLNETCLRRDLVFGKCADIWGRARKPILAFAMLDDRAAKVLGQVRLLTDQPNAYEYQGCVELLEAFVESSVSTAATALRNDAHGRHADRSEDQPTSVDLAHVPATGPYFEPFHVDPTASSYAASNRAGSGQIKARGRPATIPETRKVQALKAFKTNTTGKRSREAAKILYATKDPTRTQRDNVYSILRAYCKKCGVKWPPDDSTQNKS